VEWLDHKDGKITGKKTDLGSAKDAARKEALAAEAKKNEERGAAIAAKNTPPVEEVEEEAPVAETDETPAAETETPADSAE